MVEEGGFAHMLCLATGYLVPGMFVGPLGALALCSVCLIHSANLLGTILKLVLVRHGA